MTEYLKELDAMKEGDEYPPINLGPYDNPLLWNVLDPYGADRPHQRRPLSVDRGYLELMKTPLRDRDHCVHRWIPWKMCIRNLRPLTTGSAACVEFEESLLECIQTERYRSSLLKTKFLNLTRDYSQGEKKFFANADLMGPLYYSFSSFFWTFAASQRLSGWDDNDPRNPMSWREPNRARMRALFAPTLYEKDHISGQYAIRMYPQEITKEELPMEFPLPDAAKPIIAPRGSPA